MKNKKLIILVGLLLLVGCSGDEKYVEQQGNVEVTKAFSSFIATLDDVAETRAYLSNTTTSTGKRRMFWQEGDAIGLSSDLQKGFKSFQARTVSADNVAVFTGDELTGNQFLAVYPFDDIHASCWYFDKDHPNILHTCLYAEAPATYNGYQTVAPMIATGDGNQLNFKQTTGMIHVAVSGIYQIELVSLYGANHEKLMGNAYIDLSETEPVLKIDSTEEYVYTTYAHDINGGVTNGEVIDIYFVIPPTTFENGFTVKIEGTDESGGFVSYEKTSPPNQAIGRAEIKHYSLVDVKSELEAIEGRRIPLGPDPAVIHGKGGSTTVTISSKNDWKAVVEKGKDWINLSRSTGKNGDKLTITTEESMSDYGRYAVIIIDDGNELQRIEFIQNPNIIIRNEVVSHRKARFSSIVTYDNQVELAKVMILMPYPVSNNYQEIHSIQTNCVPQISLDGELQYGLATITSPFPASHEVFAYTEVEASLYEVHANFNAIDRELPYDRNSDIFKLYTGDSVNDRGYKGIDTSDIRIQTIGDELWEQSNGSIIEYARLCYEYVATNFEYMNANTGLHSIAELLDSGGGDCGNLSAIYVSLLRYKEIPSRIIAMLGPEDNSHVRAEFYLAGYDWIPVDVTFHMGGGDDYFGHFKDGQYIIQSRGMNFPMDVGFDHDIIFEFLQGPVFWYWWYHEGNIDMIHEFGWVD